MVVRGNHARSKISVCRRSGEDTHSFSKTRVLSLIARIICYESVTNTCIPRESLSDPSLTTRISSRLETPLKSGFVLSRPRRPTA